MINGVLDEDEMIIGAQIGMSNFWIKISPLDGNKTKVSQKNLSIPGGAPYNGCREG